MSKDFPDQDWYAEWEEQPPAVGVDADAIWQSMMEQPDVSPETKRLAERMRAVREKAQH